MKKNLFDKVIFIIVVILLFFYLKSTMTTTALREIENISASTTIILFLLVSITFFYGIINFKKTGKYFRHHPLVKAIAILFITIYIVSIFFSLANPFEGRVLYGLLLLPFTLFWFFYVLSNKYNLRKLIIISMSVLTIGLIYTYYKNYNINLNYFETETTTNTSYFVMYMLPFLLCYKNKYIKTILIVITILVVFSSLKRTGSIAVILAIVVFIYVELAKDKKKWKNTLFIIILGTAVYYLISYGGLSDNILISRFEKLPEDQGSGRILVWESTWEMIKESNVLQVFFGHGFNMVQTDSPLKLSAHNDFIEVLYDFGIIGFILLLTTYIQLIRFVLKLIKIESKYAAPMAASVVLMIIGSMSSHIIIYPYYLIMFSMFWGYILGVSKVNGVSRIDILKLKNYYK